MTFGNLTVGIDQNFKRGKKKHASRKIIVAKKVRFDNRNKKYHKENIFRLNQTA